MTGRLRDYVNTVDGALSPEDNTKLLEFYQRLEKDGELHHVDIPRYADYYLGHISGNVTHREGDLAQESLTIHKLLARNTIKHLVNYQQQLGIADYQLFNEDGLAGNFAESFFFKAYRASAGHQWPWYDAMNEQTGNRFLSFTYFLNDVLDGGQFVFTQEAAIPEIAARAGRLVLHPSNWQYIHGIEAPQQTDLITVTGYYTWVKPQ